jgi:nucleoside-diphosphate-sugar epimerase
VLCDVIDSYSYESFLYLSSTRVYMGASETREETAMTVDPTSVDHVYNLSKLTGEALCLARRDRAFRVARIANVVGPGDASVNFLPSLVEEARREGSLTIRTSPQSTKDYVDIDDVCRLLEKIALNGSERIYNVASGVNVTNGEIAGLIEKRLGAKVQFVPRPPTTTFPPIDVRRVRNEFGFEPIPFHTSFDKLFGDTPAEASDDHDN